MIIRQIFLLSSFLARQEIGERDSLDAPRLARVPAKRVFNLAVARIERASIFLGAPLENVFENTVDATGARNLDIVLDGQGAVYEGRDARVAAKPIGILEAHHQDVHHLFLVEHRTLPRASAAEEGQNENENGRECVA